MDRKNAWTTYSKEELDRLEQVNTEYKNCLDAGKTERECVALAVEKAKAEGYKDIRDIIKNGENVCSMYEQNNCAVSYGYKTADRRYEYSWSSYRFPAH